MGNREPYLAELGRNIRRIRLAAGMTQREMARRTGYPVWKISRVERGVCTASVEMMARMARAAGCRICELVDGI